MVFPTYAELENRSTSRYAWVSVNSNCIYTVVYSFIGVLGTLVFGNALETNFLENMALRDGLLSIFIRLSYVMIVLCYIPYCFFALKEFTLVLIDEVTNKSLSSHLRLKIEEFN